MIIEHLIGLLIFIFISATALFSVVGWICANQEAKALKTENRRMRKSIQKLYDDLAKERSWASVVNLETEDK